MLTATPSSTPASCRRLGDRNELIGTQQPEARMAGGRGLDGGRPPAAYPAQLGHLDLSVIDHASGA
jgi:hypothetical protein